MNLGWRNKSKIINHLLYTVKLSKPQHQQQQKCSLYTLSAAVPMQQKQWNQTCCGHNNSHSHLRVNNTFYTTTTLTPANGSIWIRDYSNISSKPAESSSSQENSLKAKNNEQRSNKEEMPPPPEESDRRTLPRLMNFPEVMWPSMLNSIKNFIMVQFIIRPYMDREFDLRDFAKGAKKAMQVVSSKLMNGDFAHLGNLVSADVINEIKPVIQKLSVSQRKQLEIKESDIYLTFPYQIGIMFDEDNESTQKRWVEITMVFHALRGLQEMRDAGEEIPWNMGTLPEYQDRVFVCNYRFIKEFTKGKESDWTINIVNHFKPIDLINEMKR